MSNTSEIETYRRMFDDRYAEIDELLADLPAEALLWKPFESSPWKGSAGHLGWIIAHAISSAIYLMRRAEANDKLYKGSLNAEIYVDAVFRTRYKPELLGGAV